MAKRWLWGMLNQGWFYYELTPQNIKVLAYELAISNRHVISVPVKAIPQTLKSLEICWQTRQWVKQFQMETFISQLYPTRLVEQVLNCIVFGI